MGYGLNGRGSIPGRDLFLLNIVHTNTGTLLASCPIGIGDHFPGLVRRECEAQHSPTSNAEVKNGGAIPPLLHMSLWHDA
jgi:hypothetical protein